MPMCDDAIMTQCQRAFSPLTPPERLVALAHFSHDHQQRRPGKFFSPGFELEIGRNTLQYMTQELDPISDKVVAECIYELGDPEGDGSTLAIWHNNTSSPLEDCPVVFLGSEGDCHVYADNFNAFLRKLGFDANGSVRPPNENGWSNCTPEDFQEYLDWLATHCQLTPMSEAEYYAPALERHRADFALWVRLYLPDLRCDD